MTTFARMKRLCTYLCLLLLPLGWTACSDDDETEPESTPVESYSKVVIAYMMAENSLNNHSPLDVEEMKQGASSIPADCRLVVFLDNTALPRLLEFGPQGMRTLATLSTDVCSTDSAQMDGILTAIRQRYPAQTYGLILWSHGSGWIPQHAESAASGAPKRRTIGIDNNQNTLSNTGREMNIGTLRHVLEHHPKMEFIFFDACYMQGIETAYELKDVTDYLIGSPAETPGRGAPYDDLMPALFDRPLQPERFLEIIYNEYANSSGVLLSAVRCDELEALAAATQPHVQALFAGRTEVSTTGVQAYGVYRRETFYRPEFFDMNDFMYRHLEPDDYEAWKVQFDRAVCARKATVKWPSSIPPYYFTPILTNPERYGGLSLFVPAEKYNTNGGWNDDFRHMAWYDAAGWAFTGW